MVEKKENYKEVNKRKAKSKKIASTHQIKSEKDIAVDLASSIHKKFSDLIKATILFGSHAKNTATASSDIDLVVIIDDVSVKWDIELIAWYREELGKIVAATQKSEILHINTIKLTTWWQDLMRGDPVVLNIIRYGEPIIDVGGFFKPLKVLLVEGKMHSTPEAVYTALQRAPTHLARSKIAEMSAIEGIYWCMVDSSQAALIMAGELPPSPEHIPTMLKETFTDKKMLDITFVEWYKNVFSLHKGILHGQIKNIRGADIDLWQNRAEQFLKKMTQIIDILIEINKHKG